MDLRDCISEWLGATAGKDLSTGLKVNEALRRAVSLRRALRESGERPINLDPSSDLQETLHALSAVLMQSGDESPEVLLNDSVAALDLASRLNWGRDPLGEKQELLLRLVFLCWRHARRTGKPAAEQHWRERYQGILRETPSTQFIAEHVLATPIEERTEKAAELRLDDAELLLAVCEVLRARVETSPPVVRDDAEFFYHFLEKPKRKIGLFDEREYYMGELALIAGGANRVLFHREEARRWFDRAEASFTRAVNGLVHVARVGYQRLALMLEERRLEEVLEMSPLWVESFESMDLPEEALKCRFLGGLALREKGDLRAAIDVFRDICRRAEEQRNFRLVAQASNNLAQFYRVMGNLDEAMRYARKALPLLQQLNSQVHLVKLRWGVGSILREQGRLGDAISAYREALESAHRVGMRGDQAALHLVLADVLLDAGQDRQAEWEVRAALPIIDEEKMVPEGLAALSLLRESVGRRQIDQQALRNLHGYFRQE